MSKKLKDISKTQNKSYVAKEFQSFKSDLTRYARNYFVDQNADFSEASLGGMLLDFAAIVGESLTFYIDQQINELDHETASTEYSITNHLRKANINSGFASPSSVLVDFYILVPPITDSDDLDEKYLPIIKRETQLRSEDDIVFILDENVDFSISPEVVQDVTLNDVRYLMVKKSGICTSGEIVNESFLFSENSQGDFLSYTLSNENITKILSVFDNSSDLNEYKEVEFLSQDTIYEKVVLDKTSYINISPAVFRYVLERDFEDGLTTIRFGNSNNNINEDGILTNPEELSMPLLSRDYINNFSLDPKKLLNSKSLGVSPAGKIINVKYKFGGGEDHNVQSRSINVIDNLIYSFPNLSNENDDNVNIVINSISIINENSAVGGSDALSLEELREQIGSSLKMQSRIVTHEDLLARLYSMPSDFGRINKASIVDNPYSKSSKDLYVICKDSNNHYIAANDALKHNISKFLNEYRLIGDTFNIINANIYNFSIYIKLKVAPNYDQREVISEVQSKIYTLMQFEKLQIGQPININKIIKIVLDTKGVLTIISNFKTLVRSISGNDIQRSNSNEVNRFYNNNSFSVYDRYDNGILTPPQGGIFQLKYTDDIEIVSG